jgi:hypothetical protein
MPASSSPILVCAGLVFGAVGLGGHYLSNRDTAAKVIDAEPLFARSVEEAGLPGGRWPAVRLDVPYYGPMVELLTVGASAGRTTTADQSAAQQQTEAARETPRTSREASEVRKQQKQTRRPKEKRRNEDATSEPDARNSYAREVPERNQRRGTTQHRDDEDEDRTTRRSRSRQSEAGEGSELRRDEGRRQQSRERTFTRDDGRERERRDTRAPENRESGATPFRMFGIFDQR